MIIEWLRRGHFRKTAAARARINPNTITNWMSIGKKDLEASERDGTDPSEYARFFLDVTEAEAEAEDTHFKTIEASDSPDDAKWILQRRWPEKWGSKPSRVELTGSDGGPIEVSIADARKSFAKKLTAALEREGLAPPDPESEPGTGPEGGPTDSA